MVKALLDIIKKQFTYPEPEPETEIEVPRHIWLNGTELLATANSLGKRVEVPAVSDYHGGQTNVVGRLTTMSYDSFQNQTTITIDGPNFTATVDIYPGTMVMVHL